MLNLVQNGLIHEYILEVSNYFNRSAIDQSSKYKLIAIFMYFKETWDSEFYNNTCDTFIHSHKLINTYFNYELSRTIEFYTSCFSEINIYGFFNLLKILNIDGYIGNESYKGLDVKRFFEDKILSYSMDYFDKTNDPTNAIEFYDAIYNTVKYTNDRIISDNLIEKYLNNEQKLNDSFRYIKLNYSEEKSEIIKKLIEDVFK